MAYPYGPIYRLLLLSGLRLNEVADAVWSEFDLAKGIWTIPAARMKGKNGKARPHSVPLTADILAILRSLPRFNRGEHLFSATNGETSVWITDKVKRRLDAAMTEKLGRLPPWVNHDLRRTLRSRLSELHTHTHIRERVRLRLTTPQQAMKEKEEEGIRERGLQSISPLAGNRVRPASVMVRGWDFPPRKLTARSANSGGITSPRAAGLPTGIRPFAIGSTRTRISRAQTSGRCFGY